MTREPSSAADRQTRINVNRFGAVLVLAALVWTLIIAGLGWWHYQRTAFGYLENARTAARYSIQKDMAYRRWSTEHGGVYVPVTAKTPPNPYLTHVAERDIATPSGRELTLVNPAYMTRQVHQMADEQFGSRGKITSLNPLRPENTPDAWEEDALRSFRDGVEELSGMMTEEGDRSLRMMLPFYTEEGCLRCHGHQGYEVGDLLGGITVAIPWQPYGEALAATRPVYLFGYGGIWLLGLASIGLHRQRLRLYLRQRQRSAEEQRAQLKRLQKLAAHLPGMIYQFRRHADGRAYCPYASDGIHKLYGLTPEQVREDIDALVAVVHPQDQPEFLQSIEQSATTLADWHNQHRVLHPSGKTLWLEGHATPEPLPDGSLLWHGFVQDITDRKQAEELLGRQSRELGQRNQALEQFNYTVSHELRTPLVTVESFLAMIQQRLGQHEDRETDRQISLVRKAARRMNQLLDSLMRLFRLDTVTAAEVEQPFAELAGKVVDTLQPLATSRGVRVEIKPASLLLRGDEERLTEIWSHLTENAIVYMGDQSEPLVEIGADRDDEVVFYVRDNGSGIEAPYQERIFGLFDKLAAETEGSGLGLALVRRIVEFYGGRIWVESAGKGQGSCFRFTLPQAVVIAEKPG